MALSNEERISVSKESASNGEWVKISIQKVHTLLEMEDNDDRKSFLDYMCIDLNYVEEQRNNLMSKHRNLVQELNTCKEQLLVLKQAMLDLLTMHHVNTEILKENQNLRNELKEITSITEAWLNSSNKVNHSGPKDPVFVKSSVDNLEVSTSSNKPKLSETEDSTLSNYDTGKHPLPPLEKLIGAEPISGPKTIKLILKSTSSFKAETLKGITINEPSSAARGNKSPSVSKTNSAPVGKKREALQAKKVESFKSSKTESSSALRSKTPTKSIYQSLPAQIWDVPGPEGMYVKNFTHWSKGYGYVNTPIMPHNMLGPDLKGKAVNESQYRGMIRPLMNLTASRPNIQFSIALSSKYKESHLISIENFQVPKCKSTSDACQLLEGKLVCYSANKQQSTAMFSTKAEDIVAAGCYAIILWIKSQLADYDIIYEKLPITIQFCTKKTKLSNMSGVDDCDVEIWYDDIDQNLSFILTKKLSAQTAVHCSNCCLLNPTGGIYDEVGVNTFRNTIGAHYLPHSSEYVAPSSIDIVRPWFKTIRHREVVPTKRTLKKSLLPHRWRLLMAHIIQCLEEDIIIKLNKKHREKVVPCTRSISLLMMHKMKECYGDGELTLYPTQVFSVNNWALKPNQPKEPPFTYHMLAICAADKPVGFKAPKTSSKAESVFEGSKPGAKFGHKKLSYLKQPSVSNIEATKGGSSKAPTSSKTGHSKKKKDYDASADSTAEVDPRLSAPNQTKSINEGLEIVLTQLRTGKGPSSIARQIKEEDASNTIKLKDLAKLVSDVPSFKDLDLPEDDPVIIVDDSNEDEEDEVHTIEDTSIPKSSSPMSSQIQELTNQVLILQSQKHKLELEKNKAETEVALLKA
ncbi:hypothetical protein Tco_0550545 [Tanacetum coccineum]